MVRVYFEDGHLKDKKTSRLSNIGVMLYGVFFSVIFLGFMFLIPLVAYSFSLVLIYLIVVIVFAIPAVLYSRKYRRKAKVRICDDGIYTYKGLVRWADIEDVKIISKMYIDSEVEGAPVLGYSVHGMEYGYAPSRTISYQKYKYPIIQIFHKWGDGGSMLSSITDLWKFIKAIIKAASNSQQVSSQTTWLQKLKRMDEQM